MNMPLRIPALILVEGIHWMNDRPTNNRKTKERITHSMRLQKHSDSRWSWRSDFAAAGRRNWAGFWKIKPMEFASTVIMLKHSDDVNVICLYSNTSVAIAPACENYSYSVDLHAIIYQWLMIADESHLLTHSKFQPSLR